MFPWEDLVREITGYVDVNGNIHPGMDLDVYRRTKIQALSNHTGRNTVTYYSGYLADREHNVDVNDTDINGFINIFYDLDSKKGLDLIIHSPGGSPNAAEGIVKYMHQKFGNDIRVIVPQSAFSAGTMIACASKQILMGEYSCLGPIDPQLNGIPVYDMIQEFNSAKRDLKKDPANEAFWRMRLAGYPAGIYPYLQDATKLSSLLVGEWLQNYMFYDETPEDAAEKAKSILKTLNANNKSHGRHFTYDFCKNLGLNVELLSADPDVEDLVLDLHNAYTATFMVAPATKIMENQFGRSYITVEVPRGSTGNAPDHSVAAEDDQPTTYRNFGRKPGKVTFSDTTTPAKAE